MIKKTPTGHYVFPRLEKYKDLIHGVSSINFGDMNFMKKENEENIKKLAKTSGFRFDKMIFMEQLHTKRIKEVNRTSSFVYKKVDSLITTKNIVLNTISADCVPLIFFDPATRTIAVAHSGWKGTYKNIAESVLKKFKEKRINPTTVIVAIGPSISSCCYDIDSSRAKKFRTKYRNIYKKFLIKKKGQYFLDLPGLIKSQLIYLGISPENIEDSGICTQHTSDFFSFRKQSNIGNTKVFLTSIGLI